MKIYHILPNRYYGGETSLPDHTLGIPIKTTRTPPPPVGEGQYLIWNGNGWLLTKIPPPPDSEPVDDPDNDMIDDGSSLFDDQDNTGYTS